MHLGYGLAAILGFIGVKLILHALHENNLSFINDGAPVNVIEISTAASLYVIGGILLVTIIASLTSRKGKAKSAVANLRQLATEYLDLDDAAMLPRVTRAWSAYAIRKRGSGYLAYDPLDGASTNIRRMPSQVTWKPGPKNGNRFYGDNDLQGVWNHKRQDGSFTLEHLTRAEATRIYHLSKQDVHLYSLTYILGQMLGIQEDFDA